MKTILDGGLGSSVGADESGVDITAVGSIDWGNNVGVGGAFVGVPVDMGAVVIHPIEIIMLVKTKNNLLNSKNEDLHRISLLNPVIIL